MKVLETAFHRSPVAELQSQDETGEPEADIEWPQLDQPAQEPIASSEISDSQMRIGQRTEESLQVAGGEGRNVSLQFVKCFGRFRTRALRPMVCQRDPELDAITQSAFGLLEDGQGCLGRFSTVGQLRQGNPELDLVRLPIPHFLEQIHCSIGLTLGEVSLRPQDRELDGTWRDKCGLVQNLLNFLPVALRTRPA